MNTQNMKHGTMGCGGTELMPTLSRDKTRQVVAVVHIDNARASSAAANLALTFQNLQFVMNKPNCD